MEKYRKEINNNKIHNDIAMEWIDNYKKENLL